MSSPLLVTAHIDGPCVGLVEQPVMLDGPLAWAAWQRVVAAGEPLRPIDRDAAADFPLPLERWERGDTWGWCTSAADVQVLAYSGAELRRKPATGPMARFTADRSHHQGLGPYKARDTTAAFAWISTAIWHVLATDRSDIEALLAPVTHLGKHHRLGFGQVRFWTVEDDPEAQAWRRRPLPGPGGRIMGVRAPYWHPSRQAECVIPV